MNTIEMIENVVDNLKLERQTNQCRKGYAKFLNSDLSVFDTYNGDEFVQAVIDEFELINAPVKQTSTVAFTQGIYEGFIMFNLIDLFDAKSLALIEVLTELGQQSVVVDYVMNLIATGELCQQCNEFNVTANDILTAIEAI